MKVFKKRRMLDKLNNEDIQMSFPVSPVTLRACRLAVSGIMSSYEYNVEEIESTLNLFNYIWELADGAEKIKMKLVVLSRLCIKICLEISIENITESMCKGLFLPGNIEQLKKIIDLGSIEFEQNTIALDFYI